MTQDQLRELVYALLYSLAMCDHMGDVSNVVDDLLQIVEPFGVVVPAGYKDVTELAGVLALLPPGTGQLGWGWGAGMEESTPLRAGAGASETLLVRTGLRVPWPG